MPRGMGEMENQLLGSSVTFVGDSGRIVAAGSGVLGAPVNIYHKPGMCLDCFILNQIFV